MSDAQKLIDLAIDLTKARYKIDPKTQAPPLVFAVKNDQVIAELGLNFDSDFSKTLSIAAADLFLKSQGCDGSIFTSEAWMAVATGKDAENGLLKGPRPAERPDRVEVLLAEVSTKDHYIIAMFNMERDRKGRLKNLKEFERFDSKKPRSDGLEMKSRFDFFAGLESTQREIAEMEAQGATKQ